MNASMMNDLAVGLLVWIVLASIVVFAICHVINSFRNKNVVIEVNATWVKESSHSRQMRQLAEDKIRRDALKASIIDLENKIKA